MYPMTSAEMNGSATALAFALSHDYAWSNYGDGVIGTDVNGRDLIVAVQEDGTVTVCLWAEGNEYVDRTVDDVAYDVDAVRAAIATLI